MFRGATGAAVHDDHDPPRDPGTRRATREGAPRYRRMTGIAANPPGDPRGRAPGGRSQWLHEGERLLERIPKDLPHVDRRGLYSLAVAERSILSGDKRAAIPYLQQAARQEKNKRQRARMYYLLGQLLQENNRPEEARKAYSKVLRASPPFALDFAARIRKMELEGERNPRTVAARLERMAKKGKYKEVLDQIFYAAGNIYMDIPDTLAAIKAYTTGIEKSTARGADFALCQIRLGDIYMQRKQYLKAQPCFSATILPTLCTKKCALRA